MPENYKLIDDRKFMWDGRVYDTEAEAESIASGYQKDNFETQIFHEYESGKYFVYNRRVITQVVVEAAQ